MQSVSIIKFYKFGAQVRYLNSIASGILLHGDSYVIANIESVLKLLADLNLPVSRGASEDLKTLLKTYKAQPEDSKLTKDQAAKLKETVRIFRKTLDSEIRLKNAFVISQKRIDAERLLEDVSSLLAPGVFQILTPHAKYDFKEAGRCIAFETPTAAAFHLMRGTESELRALYCFFVKRNRINPMLWGPMIQALTAHRVAKAHTALLKNLDNIRVSFRNPTQHPEKIYDIQEVQDLWGLCVEVVNKMAKLRPSAA